MDRHCVHPRIPQMAVVGYAEGGASIYLYEMMAKWVAHLLDGAVRLPGVADMERSTRIHYGARASASVLALDSRPPNVSRGWSLLNYFLFLIQFISLHASNFFPRMLIWLVLTNFSMRTSQAVRYKSLVM